MILQAMLIYFILNVILLLFILFFTENVNNSIKGDILFSILFILFRSSFLLFAVINEIKKP